jgi:hypothetical protein
VFHAHIGAIEEDGFLRQPFQLCTCTGVQAYHLARMLAVGAIPLARTGRGQQGMGTFAHLGRDGELVAAHDPARGWTMMAWQMDGSSG